MYSESLLRHLNFTFGVLLFLLIIFEASDLQIELNGHLEHHTLCVRSI